MLHCRMRVLLIIFVVSTINSSNAQSKCDISGQCLGDYLDSTATDTPVKCLAFCQHTQGCQWYTHDSSNDFCFAFSNCPEIDTSCSTCLSGQSTCTPPQCFVTGKCLGRLVGSTTANSQEDCLRRCQVTEDSAWFSFNLIEHHCMFFEGCDLEPGDGYFISGERNCNVSVPEFSKIVIQHGPNVNWISVPKLVLDRHDQQRCSSLPGYPESVQGAVDAVIDDQVVICGGNYTASCHFLSRELNLWLEFEPMSEPRYYSASSTTPYGWWVTGGRSGSTSLSSTELYNSTSKKWSPGPSLPIERQLHCIVQINNALSFLTGGGSDLGENSNRAWIYSWPDDRWTELPVLPSSRLDMACDVFTDRSGVKHILTAGGDPDFVSVDSFNLDTNSWQSLPDLPSPADNGPAFVQDGKNIFLVNPYYNNVMVFNEETLTFEIVNGQGTGVTGIHAAVVPINDENLHGCYSNHYSSNDNLD